jgi:hypothetical protein
MKIALYVVLITTLPTILQAQVLNGDERFPVVNQIRWDMSKEGILKVCSANKVTVGGNDTIVSFEVRALDAKAKAYVRFKNKAERPWVIEVKFNELTEKIVDTLINHFTRTTGESPRRAAKEKSLLLFTMRMELAVWKTKLEHIRLMVGKQGKSIFDINLSIAPV